MWHTLWHMRTTLDIDDRLMHLLMEQSAGKTKKAAVEEAIRAFLARSTYERVQSLIGKIEFDEEAMREFRKGDRIL